MIRLHTAAYTSRVVIDQVAGNAQRLSTRIRFALHRLRLLFGQVAVQFAGTGTVAVGALPMYRNEVIDLVTGDERLTEHYCPSQSLRQSVMPQGVIHGDAADIFRTLGGVTIGKHGFTRNNTPLGLDDVEVPYGTFNDCLRMCEEVNAVHRASWYCPGVGLIKRMVGDLNNRTLRELVKCTGCPDQPGQ